MKREFLKLCLFVLISLFAVRTYASEDHCDCYMEYQSIEAEAKVYADEKSREASMTEFTNQQKMEILQAMTLLAEG